MRLFDIVGNNVQVDLIGLTITGGRTALDDEGGGAIRATGLGRSELNIIDSVVSGNHTTGIGSKGGAIFSRDELTIFRSTISNNFTFEELAGGGATYSPESTAIIESTVAGNGTIGPRSFGGAIQSDGTLIAGSTFSNNFTLGELSLGGAVSISVERYTPHFQQHICWQLHRGSAEFGRRNRRR